MTVSVVLDAAGLRRSPATMPGYAGGRPATFTLPQRRAIKKIALSVPSDLGRPFATWSLAKLADYLVAEGVVTDISHEGLRALLREEGVSFQAVRTWKRSIDPAFEPKKNRILELYELAEQGKSTVAWVAPPGRGRQAHHFAAHCARRAAPHWPGSASVGGGGFRAAPEESVRPEREHPPRSRHARNPG